MKIGNLPVPREKLGQFYEIFHATGCRHTSNPYWSGNTLYVSFEPGDYSAFQEAWQRMNTPIREVDMRPGMIKKLWRRVMLALRPNARGNRSDD